ncbi:hypothetical protein [Mycoplasma capricolum]|uniref:YobI-like P-loop NTPase domain-containing protein n=1 Tax=Mycoplasma capricolum subsp. capricolum 14232 TaxID=1188238 RepID=A0A084EKH4_MYCCA|nr:hypothetical protein [Mycoplasma capricolum]KEZ18466.1 Hypothetical protein, predicted transmembrane protein [Mycoplasma capricolum subsp. capricolum 14232]
MIQKKSFNTLGPITLKQNIPIYDEALDFAISSSETTIKNIGISGPYSAGKSTIWNSYIKNKHKNIISISLAKYSEMNKLDNLEKNSSHDISENRIERQIINQIISQINPKLIQLFSSKIKENNTKLKNILYFLSILSILIGIIGLSVKSLLISLSYNYLWLKSLLLSFFVLCISVPISFFIFGLVKNKVISISRFSIKNVDFKLDNAEDETIFDKEIKQIVYLLYSSRVDFVVFDDLDRFKKIEIFEKLKQLNSLLNNFYKTKNKDKVVKFIYMISDDLFDSESRTKFFDFIVPIIPIKSSKEFIKQQLQKIGIVNIDDKYLDNLKDVITNTRVFLNTINEYFVYERLVILEEQLNNDRDRIELFNTILFKNLIPNEFQLLQNNEGIVYEVFKKNIYFYQQWAKNVFLDDIKMIQNKLELLTKNFGIQIAVFEFILQNLTNVLGIYDDENTLYVDYDVDNELVRKQLEDRSDQEKLDTLFKMFLNKNNKVKIKYTDKHFNFVKQEEFTYYKFINKFVEKDNELLIKINKFRNNIENEIVSLKWRKQLRVDQILNIDTVSINNLLITISWENSNNKEAKEWFQNIKNKNNENDFNMVKKLFKSYIITENYIKYINYIN